MEVAKKKGSILSTGTLNRHKSFSALGYGISTVRGSLHTVFTIQTSELATVTSKLKQENFIRNLENIVLQRYLMKMEPSCLLNMEVDLEKAQVTAVVGSSFGLSTGTFATRADLRSSAVFKLPPISITTRIDMTEREIEAEEMELEKLQSKIQARHRNCFTNIKEIRMRVDEINASRELLEKCIKNATHPLTKQLPSLKMLRFIEEWLKKIDHDIQNYRINRTKLTRQYKEICNWSEAKGLESTQNQSILSEIDFGHIHIQNKQLLEEIATKSQKLREERQALAKTALIVMLQKQHVLQQTLQFDNLKKKIHEKEQRINRFEYEHKAIKAERDHAFIYLQNLETLKNKNDKNVNTVDYLSSCSELHDLKREVKYAKRRREVQKKLLVMLRRKCKLVFKNLYEDLMRSHHHTVLSH